VVLNPMPAIYIQNLPSGAPNWPAKLTLTMTSG
jgi:hypothetical protein